MKYGNVLNQSSIKHKPSLPDFGTGTQQGINTCGVKMYTNKRINISKLDSFYQESLCTDCEAISITPFARGKMQNLFQQGKSVLA